MSDLQSSSAFGRIVICLPLVKFSFATLTPGMTSVPWSHKVASDIFVLVEHVNSEADPNLQLRVVEATNTLENISLSHHVEAALRMKEAHESTSGPLKRVEHLPIFGMTKESAIAIRFNTKEGHSRRVQMNFADDKDRKELLHLLEDMGMVVTPIPPKVKDASKSSSIQPSFTTSSSSFSLLRSQSTPQNRSTYEPSSHHREPLQASEPPSARDSSVLGTLHAPSSYIDATEHQQSAPEEHLTTYTRISETRTPEEYPIKTSSEHSVSKLSRDHAPASPPVITLQDLLPPRRVLPFARPSSSKSKPDALSHHSDSPSRLAETLTPLPTPTFAGEDSSPQGRFARIHTSMHPSKDEENVHRGAQKRPAVTFEQQRAKLPRLGMPAPPLFYERPDGIAPKTREYDGMAIHEDRVEDNHGRGDRLSSSSTYNHSSPATWSPNRSSRPSISGSDGFAPSSSLVQPSSPPRPALATLPTAYANSRAGAINTAHDVANDFDRILANSKLQPSQTSNSSDWRMLAAYASQPREQRLDVLNSLIVDYLEDLSFRTLCNDMDGAWRWGLLNMTEERGENE